MIPPLRMVAWEITRQCNLFCAHCRGSSKSDRYDNELSFEESFSLIDEIAAAGNPILILTGGEPLVRPDIFAIARYGTQKGLRVAMGSNGTLVTREVAGQLGDVPLSRLAVSLDFPTARKQDTFRGKPGAFDLALAGIANARQAGIEIQINTTVTQQNVGCLPDLLNLVVELGAVAFHPFMLVPTGRGKGLASEELSPEQYEETLNWIYDKQLEMGDSLFFKPTDAPHYLRVVSQRQERGLEECTDSGTTAKPLQRITRGCLAGTGFCFISHRGRVQGCGYLDIEAGNVRQQPFSTIWGDSSLFHELRDFTKLKGRCGVCEYVQVCGGCRARAYEATGDYLQAEPYCIYQPANWKGTKRTGGYD